MNYKELAMLLSEAPESQLDPSMIGLIKQWSSPPTPLQVLEVLDKCIFAALASQFVVSLLQQMFFSLCKENNTTLDEVAKSAIWRVPGNY